MHIEANTGHESFLNFCDCNPGTKLESYG